MAVYFCPMHSEVRLNDAGKFPKCGMPLIADGTRFALLQHLAGNPMMLAAMAAVMVVAMAAAMMLMR